MLIGWRDISFDQREFEIFGLDLPIDIFLICSQNNNKINNLFNVIFYKYEKFP